MLHNTRTYDYSIVMAMAPAKNLCALGADNMKFASVDLNQPTWSPEMRAFHAGASNQGGLFSIALHGFGMELRITAI